MPSCTVVINRQDTARQRSDKTTRQTVRPWSVNCLTVQIIVLENVKTYMLLLKSVKGHWLVTDEIKAHNSPTTSYWKEWQEVTIQAARQL